MLHCWRSLRAVEVHSYFRHESDVNKIIISAAFKDLPGRGGWSAPHIRAQTLLTFSTSFSLLSESCGEGQLHGYTGCWRSLSVDDSRRVCVPTPRFYESWSHKSVWVCVWDWLNDLQKALGVLGWVERRYKKINLFTVQLIKNFYCVNQMQRLPLRLLMANFTQSV